MNSSLPLTQDWAFIRTRPNTILVGLGPFTRVADCPKDTLAFYSNSFDLTDPKPWLIPVSHYTLADAEFQSLFPPSSDVALQWDCPNVEPFAQIFDQISHCIQHEGLQKSVPVNIEQASCDKTTFLQLASRLIPASLHTSPYGICIAGEGVIGASPETLFTTYEGKLRTMALAGTAKKQEKEIFTFDQKEIQEHEYVASTLLDSLTKLGMTRRSDRSILELEFLIHFITNIEVELYRNHKANTLIRHLHPTPALGPLPRTERSMQQLMEWRKQLHCPPAFGAPFGVCHKGRLELLVAIRMLSWKDNTLSLPSGCGVIEASRLTNEWRELQLKKDSVKRFFQLL